MYEKCWQQEPEMPLNSDIRSKISVTAKIKHFFSLSHTHINIYTDLHVDINLEAWKSNLYIYIYIYIYIYTQAYIKLSCSWLYIIYQKNTWKNKNQV